MKEKDDLIILIFYINLTGYDFNAVNEIVKLTDEQLFKVFDDIKGYKIKHFVIPASMSKVECVYPQFISDKSLKEKQDGLLDKLNNMVTLINKNYEIRLTDSIEPQPQSNTHE